MIGMMCRVIARDALPYSIVRLSPCCRGDQCNSSCTLGPSTWRALARQHHWSMMSQAQYRRSENYGQRCSNVNYYRDRIQAIGNSSHTSCCKRTLNTSDPSPINQVRECNCQVTNILANTYSQTWFGREEDSGRVCCEAVILYGWLKENLFIIALSSCNFCVPILASWPYT
jgi:hypothetical protein